MDILTIRARTEFTAAAAAAVAAMCYLENILPKYIANGNIFFVTIFHEWAALDSHRW